MNDLLQSGYFDFFSIGSLIAVSFNFFIVLLFLTIKNKSSASKYLMLLYLSLGIQNIGYLYASVFYHPLAAYHRWITVLSVTPGLIYMTRFFYSFPYERNPRTARFFLWVQWIIALVADGVFFYATFKSEVKYQFSGHYWDFTNDSISFAIALMLNIFIILMIVTGVWRIIVSKGKDRINVLLMLACFMVITIIPGIFNAASRAGIIDRGVFQITWNIMTVLGFFLTIVVYINITNDRTTILAKIVGISLVTILLMFQGLSYYLIGDIERSYDMIHLLKTERFIDNRKKIPDDLQIVYRFPAEGKPEVLYNRDSITGNFIALGTEYRNTLSMQKLLRRNIITESYINEIMPAVNIEFRPYLEILKKHLKEKRISSFRAKEAEEYIYSISHKISRHSAKIELFPESDFMKAFEKYSSENINSGCAPFFAHAARIAGEARPESGKREIVMSFFSPVEPLDTRQYMSDKNPGNHLVIYHHADTSDNSIISAGYLYRDYRKFIHPSAFKIKIIILAVLSVMLIIFPLFLLRTIMKPFYALVSAMKLVNEGDFKVNVPVRVKDEIGYLSAHFNKMVNFMDDSTTTIEAMKTNLQNIIDSIHSVLISVDRDHKITFCNTAAAAISGMPADKLRLKYVYDLVPYITDYRAAIERTIKENIHQKIEKVHAEINGENRILEMRLFSLTGGSSGGAVIIIDDITSQVRMEEAVVQSEKMMSLGGLAAGMAHEINNPLSGILMASQNIIRRISPELPKNRETADNLGIDLVNMKKYLEERQIIGMLEDIREMGERASKIVQNMLSFSRKSGSQMLQTDLRKILESTIELAQNDYDLKKKYDFRHIKITRDFAENISEVECVSIEIQQVILNLLKNAAQALQRNKPMLSGEPEIKIRLYNRDKYVIIEITDNGHGMSDAVCKRIFEPFFTTKEVGSGTGLGLSVSYFIIKNKHKGDMYADSMEGKGTTFTIKLPVSHEYD